MDERLLVAEIFLWHFGRKLTFWSPMSTYLFHFESFLMEGIKGRYTSSWCLISSSGPDGAPRKYEAWNKVFCWLEGSRPHRSADETVSLAVIVTENTDLISTLSFIQLLSFSFTRFSIHGAPYTWKALPHPHLSISRYSSSSNHNSDPKCHWIKCHWILQVGNHLSLFLAFLECIVTLSRHWTL